MPLRLPHFSIRVNGYERRAESLRKAFRQDRSEFCAAFLLTFLSRPATVHPSRVSVIHGTQRFTWAQTFARCRQLASALVQHAIGPGDTVSMMAPISTIEVEGVLYHYPAVLEAAAVARRIKSGERHLARSSP